MKIAFGMIVFEGDYVLRECLEQVYPYASQILIAEGPVQYWQEVTGSTTSRDNTNSILDNFPDPDNKITVVHGQYSEKDDQCKAYMDHINDDIDYIWNLDSDEVYSSDNLEKIINVLDQARPTSVGIRSISFFGGFGRYMTGFELNRDNFLRIFRYVPGSNWLTHRPPTIHYPNKITRKHIHSDDMFFTYKTFMHHYSYVFPKQVYNKVSYYKACISKQNCIDNYFHTIYLPWVNGNNEVRKKIEDNFAGVHEFKPGYRGRCFTAQSTYGHPESILKNLPALKDRFNQELKSFNEN